jgi:hypothetical protein
VACLVDEWNARCRVSLSEIKCHRCSFSDEVAVHDFFAFLQKLSGTLKKLSFHDYDPDLLDSEDDDEVQDKLSEECTFFSQESVASILKNLHQVRSLQVLLIKVDAIRAADICGSVQSVLGDQNSKLRILDIGTKYSFPFNFDHGSEEDKLPEEFLPAGSSTDPGLYRLVLLDCFYTEEQLSKLKETLCASSSKDTLLELHIAFGVFVPEIFTYIAGIINNCTMLRSLDMSRDYDLRFDSGQVNHVHLSSSALKESKLLEHLNLNCTGISDALAGPILNALAGSESIQLLEIQRTRIAAKSLPNLALLLGQSSTLVQLDLSFNYIFNKVEQNNNYFSSFCSALRTSKSLKQLNLDKTWISDDLAGPILKALAESQSIQFLKFRENRITSESLPSLPLLLRQSSTLVQLNLSGNKNLFNNVEPSFAKEQDT